MTGNRCTLPHTTTCGPVGWSDTDAGSRARRTGAFPRAWPSSTGRSSTSRAAEEVRVTFGPDTGASAARFWLPRLDSEESLAAADAAGLDREQVRALGSELRRWWSGGIDAPDLGLDEVQGRPPTPGEVAAAEEIRALGG